ncbi:hypothetical protein [Candidatus Nitrosocosmicus sp. SS]|uniref:hypothetical protein n=1 Tax=Candidatus Nitrosocosmicus agrestis TaxID=2563600 RepID=UPI00122EA112|nr:hypothetical protein [Candidatus Nitrosocosmicus sp. SS]KAA2280249.1 hypothetical protein F1Z66_11650 [Candidatus Nitrosocosmicus sp. SS]KAF0869494.1 hypothetical protein E5N71_04495 [Candidatus Nitrosocosmicus sp. SS]
MTWKIEGMDDILDNIIISNENARFRLSEKYDYKIVIESIEPKFTKFKTRLRKSFEQLNVEENDIIKIVNHVSLNYSKFYPEFSDEVADEGDGESLAETTLVSSAKVSDEEWKITLNEKYDLLQTTVNETFPDIWPTIEFTLSSMMILHIKKITLPFIGIILGPPSSAKTLVLELLRGKSHTYYTDSFTARAFVSHNSAVQKSELKHIDLIPKIKNNLFMTPELGPTFSNKDEELVQTLGIITRLADGHGYESDTGALGHRGYSEETMFVWIGAAVEIPRKVYKLLGTLGPKLYFYRMELSKRSDKELLEEIEKSDFKERRERIKKALIDYLFWFEKCPFAEPRKPKDLLKVPWDDSKDQKKVFEYLVKLGRLLSVLRGVTTTWETKESQGAGYAYTMPSIEYPSRAITSLSNIAKGHALMKGRNFLTTEDISITTTIALSTAPIERVKIFDLLLEMHGTLSASNIERILKISKTTALKTMKELEILGIANIERDSESVNAVQKCILKKEFEWFLLSEFKALRQGFVLHDTKDHAIRENLFEGITSDTINKDQTNNTEENESVKKNHPHEENNFSERIDHPHTTTYQIQSSESESDKQQGGRTTRPLSKDERD